MSEGSPFDAAEELSPPRIVEYGPTGLALEYKGGKKISRLFLHESMKLMTREAILSAIGRGGYVIYQGPDGFARLGPRSVVVPAGVVAVDVEHVSIPMFTEELRDPTESRSWFDLATFFLSREIREVVRGDILETRAKMTRRGYHRAWIEAVTAVELARSLGSSWGAALWDLVVNFIKGMLGT